MADIHNQQDHESGFNPGQRHVQDPLETSRAIDGRRLIQTGIDRGHSGDIDDGAPADFFPDVNHADQPPEILPLSQEEDRFLDQAQAHQQFVDGTRAGKQVLRHTDHDNHGQEVGQVGYRLHGTFKFTVADFVQQHCQQHSRHRTENQVNHAHGQRISDAVDEILAAEQPREILQTHHLASGNTQFRLIILESRNPEIHGIIIEEEDVQEHRHRHQHQLPLSAKRLKEPLFSYRLQLLSLARDTGHDDKPLSEKTMGRDLFSPHGQRIKNYLLSRTL